MKILVVSGIDPFASSNNRLHYFLQALVEMHDVLVVSIRDTWKRGQVGQDIFTLEQDAVRQKLRVKPFHTSYRSALRQELYAFLRPQKVLSEDAIASFDCVYIYNALLSGYSFSRLAKKNGKRVIIDIADDLPAMVRESPQQSWIVRVIGKYIASAVIHWQAKNANRIILSASVLTALLPRTLQHRAVIIRNGVTVNHFQEAQSMSKTGGVHLGYVGVLREWVSFESIFQAMLQARTLNVTLTIIGSEGRFQELRCRVQQLGLENQVQFLGAVPYAALPKKMKIFSIGVIPFVQSDITRGALPLKLYEYAAASKVIISSLLPEVKTVAGNEIFYADTTSQYLELFNNFGKSGIPPVQYTFLREADWKTIERKFLDYVECA